ncbi:MAG: RNA polymerase sigma factor [Proteobacteria bacterium]|nr:RNA polymerase sigma factor [Pseudomonadota bacterium]
MGTSNVYQFSTTKEPNSLALKADRALAKLASSGDRDAFRTIVETNKQRMFTVARSVMGDAALAEDIVQEAFIKAYRALPEFKGQSRLSTWLHRITYLTAIDMHRQRARLLRLASESLQEETAADEHPAVHSDSDVVAQRLKTQINHAMATLTDFEQTVFTLRHMQNFKLREIAQVVNRSEGTVKNILFRAIRKMRAQLGTPSIALQERERCCRE